MLTFEEIKTALLFYPPTKVAISSGSNDIAIFGASTNPSDNYIWVAPFAGEQFKITPDHSLKILN